MLGLGLSIFGNLGWGLGCAALFRNNCALVVVVVFTFNKTRSKFDHSSRQSTWDIFIPHFVLQKSIIGSLPLSRREQK